ncbi:uncharacterized protein LOC119287593 isoform X2 [Triticum dicoccoides]|uniref:uncharacterized protein LOC119287593 isoform X2 n=1 Tax=Triticum dicoccoides TaxID=85692 RepID=UPI00188E2979|nr:uncharacterized protein LOC119287593 isoform X2 [Triticum dicoccoides]XP_037423060.1 uncharacterized protein LOC119287593 isoform X2 [Triticum dicoccoides]
MVFVLGGSLTILGCSDEDKLLLQLDGPSRLLCLFLLLPPHVGTQSRRCIEGSMSSPPAERQAGVGLAHRLSAPSHVSIHGSAVLGPGNLESNVHLQATSQKTHEHHGALLMG